MKTWLCVQGLRLEPPYTGVPRPFGPEIPKKSQKGLPGHPGPECQSVEKVPKDPKKSQKDIKISVRGLFRHFFDTPGGEAWEDLFETFRGFRGSGAWRLLCMGIAIVMQGQEFPESYGVTPASPLNTWTWFWLRPDSNLERGIAGPNQVQNRSKTCPNQVLGEGWKGSEGVGARRAGPAGMALQLLAKSFKFSLAQRILLSTWPSSAFPVHTPFQPHISSDRLSPASTFDETGPAPPLPQTPIPFVRSSRRLEQNIWHLDDRFSEGPLHRPVVGASLQGLNISQQRSVVASSRLSMKRALLKKKGPRPYWGQHNSEKK